MVFTPDEEYILYITQTLVRHLHIIWIGVSALGFDFYMGPGLEYFLVPFIWLFKGDPLIWGILTSLMGVITVYLVYWLGKRIFDKKTALIAATFYALSALLVYYDQQPYPTGVPLLSISMLISLYMTKYSKKYWILFGFLYGLVFHLHLSLVLVIFVAIYWAITHPKSINLKVVLLSFFAFLLVISPLIGFDYFHKFSNISAPVRVFQALSQTKSKFSLGNRLLILGKSVSRVFYLQTGISNSDEILYPCNSLSNNNSTQISWPIIFIILVLLIIYFRKKDIWKNEDKRLLLIYGFSFLVPFIFLSSIGSVEYYLLGFFPVFLLILSFSLSSVNKKITYLLLGLFIIYNTSVVIKADKRFGLETKKRMVVNVMKVIGNSTFELVETGGPCQGTAGWGYLFSVYARMPDKNTADKQFSWLTPIGNINKTDYKVIIDESRFPINVKNYQYIIEEGGFTSYILKN